MKRILFILAICAAFPAAAQPRLREDNIDEIIKALTLEEKVELMIGGAKPVIAGGIPTAMATEVPGAGGATRPVSRLGIPGTVMSDAPAGLRIDPKREGSDRTYYCTAFPVGTLLASSWDVDLVERVKAVMGNEVLEYGVDLILGPSMNIHRNPLCGRNFEYYSEDPVLSGKIGAAYSRGIQSNGVGACPKHFALNNQERNREDNDARVSRRALREIYLKNFEITVKEGHPWAVMGAYNQINGEYCQQSKDLMTTVLRDEWGFDGLVMTDWGNKDGTVKAVKAGTDLMQPGWSNEYDRILAAAKSGEITPEEIDRNVRNILNYIVKTPRFKGYKFSENPDLKAHATIGREAAGESMVLLRNEGGTLPLKGTEKVALYGVNAVDFIASGMGSGNVNKAYVVNMPDALEAAGFTLDKFLKEFYSSYVANAWARRQLTNIGFYDWWGYDNFPEADIPGKATRIEARDNDVAIIVLGRNSGEGRDMKLTGGFELDLAERELITNVSNAFHAVGKKVVVVLNICGTIETASWKNQVDAILVPWLPGQDGAHAIADVLSGRVNPSGKLTMTFPVNYMDIPSSANFPYYTATEGPEPEEFDYPQKNYDYTDYEEGIWVGYRYFQTKGVEVSYPFGHGLSYTTFGYSKPVVKADGDGFSASVLVTNTGPVAGKEVVELYVSAPAGGLEKPARELKAFGKTRLLAPGESQTLTFKVSAYELASFNESASAWETASGSYKVLFGASVEDIRATVPFSVKRPSSWAVNDVL